MLKYSLKLIYYDLVILYLNSTLKNKIKHHIIVIYTYGWIIGIICVLMYYSYDKLLKYLKWYLKLKLFYWENKTKSITKIICVIINKYSNKWNCFIIKLS